MELGKRLPFLRWSFLRMGLGARHLFKEWQVGDGREAACVEYVLAHAKPGSLDDAIRAIDQFAYQKKFLINVGDVKGRLLDAVIERQRPRRVLELGAYVGYSALRIARQLPPGGHLYSVEFNASNAELARRVLAHAGAEEKVTFLHGYLGDGGATLERLKVLLGAGELDVVFIDHAKDAYLPDLERILAAGWLHPGSVVVADNIGFPGSPAYRRYMKEQEGKRWSSRAHQTHAEYQTLFKDVVLESTLLGEKA
jgi:catechol O-methyltransferase